MQMHKWLDDMILAPRKKALPILSFPSVQLMGVNVVQLISDSGLQARGMELVAARTDSAASVGMMDLSVEAECFGAQIRFSEVEVPTVVGSLVTDMEKARALQVPPAGTGRTGLYIEAIRNVAKTVRDRPVLAGVIGPFTLAGRLMEINATMLNFYDDPDMVHTVLEKAAQFVTAYALAFKEAGADGVVMAEPLTGLLSHDLAEEFSMPYVKRVVDAVQDDEFIVMYHNCGNSTPVILDTILATGAAAFHFGNAVSMADILKKAPADVVILGNIDPARLLRNGTPEAVYRATRELLQTCGHYPNFVISSGCDIPPMTPWENIDAFYAAVRDHYGA